MNAFVLTLEENAGAYLAAAALRATARGVIVCLWLLLRAVGKVFALWRPIGLALALAGAVVLCVLCPWLPAGVALVALYGWITMPRGEAQACAVSWNSEASE